MTAFSNLRIVSRSRTIPAAEYIAEGEVYIVPREQPKEHHLVMKDNGNLFYVPPEVGFYGYVMDEKLYVRYSKDGWVTFVDNPSECLPVSATKEYASCINILRQQMSREFIQSFIVDKSVPAFWGDIAGTIQTDSDKNLPFVPVYRDAESFGFEEENPTEVVCNGNGSLVLAIALHFDPEHTYTSDARIDFVFRVGNTIVGRVSRRFTQSDSRPLLYTLSLPVVQGAVFTVGVVGDSDAVPVILGSLTEQSFVCLFGYNEVGTTPEEILAELKTVDGTGSGLDADFLDGFDSDSFLRSDTTLGIDHGGTGATDSENARDNLDVYSKEETDLEISQATPTLEEVLATGNLSGEHDITMNNGYALRTSLIKADGGQNAIDITPTLVTVEPELKARDGISLGDGGSTAKTFKASTDFSNPDPFALVSESAIKTYVDAHAGGGGGGGAGVGTLAQVLATGNVSGAKDIILAAGQGLKTNSIVEASLGSGVTIDGVVLKDNGIAVTSGTVRLSGNYPTGTDNVLLGANTGSRLSPFTSENVLIGSRAGKLLANGEKNTLLGHDAGSRLRSNTANTIVGSFTGSHSDLSITSSNNNVVLSDGTGIPVFHVAANPANTQSNQANVLAGFTIRGSTVINTILDDDTLSANRPDALATQSSIKAYIDANAGGGGGQGPQGEKGDTGDTGPKGDKGDTGPVGPGGGGGGGTLAEVLAAGNTSDTNDLQISTGQKLQTDTIEESTANRGVTIDGVVLRDRGIHSYGPQVLAGAFPTGVSNTVIGSGAGSSLGENASANLLIGRSSGSAIISENYNTMIGSFTGNQHSVDISGTSHNIILSDGYGFPLFLGRINPYNSASSSVNLMGKLSVFGTVAINAILDEDDLVSDSPTALATQSSIKAYIDANAGGGGGGGSIGTLAQVLAAGNTSGTNDIIVNTGQKIKVDNLVETTVDHGVIIEGVEFRDNGIAVTSGTVKLDASHPVGTRNTVFGEDAAPALLANSSANIVLGWGAGTQLSSGKRNTLIGSGAGSALLLEQFDTILGGFTGNEFGLDIRGTFRNIVLADGSGIPLLHGKINTSATLANTCNIYADFSINGTGSINAILDEDDLVSNSSKALATQSSVKAYIDANAGGHTVPNAGTWDAADENPPPAADGVYDRTIGGVVDGFSIVKDHGAAGIAEFTLDTTSDAPAIWFSEFKGADGSDGVNTEMHVRGLMSWRYTPPDAMLSFDNLRGVHNCGRSFYIPLDQVRQFSGLPPNARYNPGVLYVEGIEGTFQRYVAQKLGNFNEVYARSWDSQAHGWGLWEKIHPTNRLAFGSYTLENNHAFTGTVGDFVVMQWSAQSVSTTSSEADFRVSDDDRQWITITKRGLYRFTQKLAVRKIASDADNNFLVLKLFLERGHGGAVTEVDLYRSVGKTRFAVGNAVPPPLPDSNGSTPNSFGLFEMEYVSPPIQLGAGWMVNPGLGIDPINDNYLEKKYTTFSIEEVN